MSVLGLEAERTAGSAHIAPVAGIGLPDGHELWRYRDLLYFLALRDLKTRYRQTVVGVAWVVIQPLAMMSVFWLFFGELLGLQSEGLPFPLFVYPALLAWNYLSGALNEGALSVTSHAHLVGKVYFPRLVLPLTGLVTGCVDLAVASVLLIVLAGAYGVAPGPEILALPLFAALLLLLTAGVSIWLSALNVAYRDVRYAMPFLLQLWFFLTPVFYSSTILTGPWRAVYRVNPMASLVEGFRWSLTGETAAPALSLLPAALVALLLLVSGLLYFQRAERSFADVV
ncbi:MAG: ABC transporter permease [Dehalococcoidia bacterium]|nr:ABC transporter permease [Dehalococcoidia bacterium]